MNDTTNTPKITAETFKAFENNLYNAQAGSELGVLCNSPETSKEAKELFYAIHATRNKLEALTKKLSQK